MRPVANAVDIVVGDVPDDGRRLSGQVAVEILAEEGAEDISPRGPITYELVVTRLGSTVTIQGNLETTVEAGCGRCARRFEIPIERAFDAVFVTADTGETDHAVELDESDLDLDYYGGDVIDGAQLLAEQILLELPMKILCAEDCKGLCPTCGANFNENDCDCESLHDPRWASLKDLRDRL